MDSLTVDVSDFSFWTVVRVSVGCGVGSTELEGKVLEEFFFDWVLFRKTNLNSVTLHSDCSGRRWYEARVTRDMRGRAEEVLVVQNWNIHGLFGSY